MLMLDFKIQRLYLWYMPKTYIWRFVTAAEERSDRCVHACTCALNERDFIYFFLSAPVGRYDAMWC